MKLNKANKPVVMFIHANDTYIGSVTTSDNIEVLKTISPNKYMIKAGGDYLHCENIEFASNTRWNVYCTAK